MNVTLLSGLCIMIVIDYSSTSVLLICLHVYMYVLYVIAITLALVSVTQ